jgi:L-ascorbate metabolism protein UlaG (beta-lactamase superfamily)
MSVKLIYHGHANVEIHSGPHRIQIDPYYTGNPMADIPAAKANPTHILISHAHSDHVGDAVELAKRTGAPITANFEMCLHLQRMGAPNIAPMNHGGGLNLPFGRVTMTLAFHTSSFEDGAYGGEPAGFILEIAGKTIYFAGDTALFGDMKLLGELYSIDLACLPIGDCFTMGPAHAIKAAQFLKTKRVLPMHYNTFPPIAQDAGKFAKELQSQGHIAGLPLKAGQSIEI